MQHNHEVDITKLDSADYRVYCHQCGKPFEARRSDAAFCSAKCRVAFSREPEKLKNAIDDVLYQGKKLRSLATKYKRNQAMFEAMLQLQKDINIALSSFESDEHQLELPVWKDIRKPSNRN